MIDFIVDLVDRLGYCIPHRTWKLRTTVYSEPTCIHCVQLEFTEFMHEWAELNRQQAKK